eukprot:2052625-Pleurochrysis_carterae.AAC.1
MWQSLRLWLLLLPACTLLALLCQRHALSYVLFLQSTSVTPADEALLTAPNVKNVKSQGRWREDAKIVEEIGAAGVNTQSGRGSETPPRLRPRISSVEANVRAHAQAQPQAQMSKPPQTPDQLQQLDQDRRSAARGTETLVGHGRVAAN